MLLVRCQFQSGPHAKKYLIAVVSVGTLRVPCSTVSTVHFLKDPVRSPKRPRRGDETDSCHAFPQGPDLLFMLRNIK